MEIYFKQKKFYLYISFDFNRLTLKRHGLAGTAFLWQEFIRTKARVGPQIITLNSW